MGIDTSVIWAVIIYFAVFMYVLLDGFDLGIGILFPFVKGKRDRDTMMNTVAPVWDGNETWLVLGGEGLLAAFPVAYSIILSGLYLPLIFMLVGLVFRGVAFEFRFKAKEGGRHWWDKAFIGGSITAAFFQGVSLGAFLDGITVSGRSYAGGVLDWIAPFPILAGFGVIIAYTLLGSTWLIMKTEGDLHGPRCATRPWRIAGSPSRIPCSWRRCRSWCCSPSRSCSARSRASRTAGLSSRRWRWSSSAIPAWRSASGRTSSRPPSPYGKPPRRRPARVSRWSARCSSCPSS